MNILIYNLFSIFIFFRLQFEMRLNVDQQMKLLLTEDERFWRDLLNVYLVEVSIAE